MGFQQIIAGTVGRENTYGTCEGLVKASPMSFARFSTDDSHGTIRGYVGEGEFTDDPLTTFGGAGVVRIDNLQGLLRYICEQGFEHHVAANLDRRRRCEGSGHAISRLECPQSPVRCSRSQLGCDGACIRACRHAA